MRSAILRVATGLALAALSLSPIAATAAPATEIEQAATSAATISRAEIISRAQSWVAQEVPYSQQHYWSDGYRQDCSGFVSMAWKLTASETTRSLHQVSHRITKNELRAGDILLDAGSHVVIFEKWANADRTAYIGYEQTPPKTLHRQIPYPYWSGTYLPYRYDNVADAPVSAPERPGVATVSTEFTKLDVFARDDDGSFLQKRFDGANWGAWKDLGGQFKSNPAAYSAGPHRIDVLGVGLNNRIWQNTWNGTGWTGWKDTLGGTVQWTPAVTSRGGNTLDVFAVNTDEQVVHRHFNGSAWGQWTSIGGTASAPPAAIALGPDRINVAIRNGEGRLATNMWTRTHDGWWGWRDRGHQIFGAPTLSARSTQLMDVFVRDGAKTLQHIVSTNGGTDYSAAQELGATTLTTPPASVSMYDKRIDVFSRAANGHLYQRIWSDLNTGTPSGWYNWVDLGLVG